MRVWGGLVDEPKGGYVRRRREEPKFPGEQIPGLMYTQRVIKHKNYNKETKENNVALIKTSQPFNFGKSEGELNSICLQDVIEKVMASEQMQLSGWETVTGNAPSKKLQILNVQEVERQQCQDALPSFSVLDQFICVKQEEDTCKVTSLFFYYLLD